MEDIMKVSVVWRGNKHFVEMSSNASLKELGDELQKLFDVKHETIRLIVPQLSNKAPRLLAPFSEEHSGLTLQGVSIGEGKPIRMMGVSEDEVNSVLKDAKADLRIAGFDEEDRRLRQRMLDRSHAHVKLPQGPYTFCDFKALQIPGIELNHPPSYALKLMHRLAADPGIVAVMNKHRWSVGIMTELAPVGYVGVIPKCVLGLNKNYGEEISLRLRTDDLKGFRKYDSIKKTLLHELAHMVYSEHDENFYALNGELNQEAAYLDWTKLTGHTLSGQKHFQDYLEQSEFMGTKNSSRKLGGNNLDQLASARESSVAAAYRRLENNIVLSETHKEPNPDAFQSAITNEAGHVTSAKDQDAKYPKRDSSRLHWEPDPDDHSGDQKKLDSDPEDHLSTGMLEPDPDDHSGAQNRHEPDPDDHLDSRMLEPDPDDHSGDQNTHELDPEDHLDSGMLEPDPDDTVHVLLEPDPNDLRLKPSTNLGPEQMVILESCNRAADWFNLDDNAAKTVENIEMDTMGKCDESTRGRTMEGESRMQHDENTLSSWVHDEPDPDDKVQMAGITVMKIDEPDPDDIAHVPGILNAKTYEPDPDDPELRRIQDPVTAVCGRVHKAIEMLRAEVNPIEAKMVLQTLTKIISNVIENPNVVKFKRLRKGNPVIQRTVANHKAAVEILSLVGFIEDDVSDDIGKMERYLVLKRNDPGLLWLAKSSLETCLAH